MEAAGIPVVVLDFNAQTVEKHVASIAALGGVLGEVERAKTLSDIYSSAVADVSRRLIGVTDRPKVYMELGRKGADEIGNSWGNAMWGRLVETAGGVNIAKDQVAKWGPISPEHVLAQNPEKIFLAGAAWTSSDKAVVAIALVLDVLTGPAFLAIGDVVVALFAPSSASPTTSVIVWDIRLPMALMAIVVGAALGIADTAMQTILGNPLASPYTLGF